MCRASKCLVGRVLLSFTTVLSQAVLAGLECRYYDNDVAIFGSMKEAAEAHCTSYKTGIGVHSLSMISDNVATWGCISQNPDTGKVYRTDAPFHGGFCKGNDYYIDLSRMFTENYNQGKSCPSSGKPINLASGNKYIIDTDIESQYQHSLLSRPGFGRTYNSLVIQPDMIDIGVNWSHSYHRRLKVVSELNLGNHLASGSVEGVSDSGAVSNEGSISGGGGSASGLQSSLYSSKAAACVDGFAEVIGLSGSSLLKTPLKSASVSWEGKDCRAYAAGGRYIASIPVRMHGGGGGGGVMPNSRQFIATILRPDGRKLKFIKSPTVDDPLAWKPYNNQTDTELLQIPVNPIDPADLSSGYYQMREIESVFKLTDQNNTIETYNMNGDLMEVAYANGVTEALEYMPFAGSDGTRVVLSRVVNNFGKYIEFNYNNDYQINSISDDTGRQWYYAYDLSGNLQQVTKPDLSVVNYHYENSEFPHALTGITDERGVRYSTYAYRFDGLAELSYLGAPHLTADQQIDRDYIMFRSSYSILADSFGNETVYYFDKANLQGVMTRLHLPGRGVYDSPDVKYDYAMDFRYLDKSSTPLLQSKNAFGVLTRYADHNVQGDPGIIVEADGTQLQRQTEYTYDTRFRHKPLTIKQPSVVTGKFKLTEYEYDDIGNVLRHSISGYKPDGTAISRDTRYAYDGPYSQISLIDGPRLDVIDTIHFEYYPNTNVEGYNRARLRQVYLGTGQILRDNIQYSATGKVIAEERTNGLQIAYRYYPGNDRLYEIIETDSQSSERRVTRWDYLESGEIATLTFGADSANPQTLMFGYDAARRLKTLHDGMGNSVVFNLDREGNLESQQVFDAAGMLRKQLSQAFDSVNRLDVFSQMNESIDYQYLRNGKLEKVTDGKGVVTEYQYDELQRLQTTVENAGGVNVLTQDVITGYGYDVQDNLTRVEAANGAVTEYEYDDLGNLVRQLSPDTGETIFTYDEAGNVMSRRDARLQTFYYAYDSQNRLLSIDAPGEQDDIEYLYDTCLQGAGRLCVQKRGIAKVEYSYNAFGDVTGYKQTVLEKSYGYDIASNQVAYEYDPVGRMKVIHYPSGAHVIYHYDAAGNIENITLNQQGVTQSLTYSIKHEPFGEVRDIQLGNHLSSLVTYDMAFRPASISLGNVFTQNISQYDANGNITQMGINTGQGDIINQYDYDELNRVSYATTSYGNINYEYDKSGNRELLKFGLYENRSSYMPATNRMLTFSGNNVDMDENGNITLLRGQTLKYSTDNRLINYADKQRYAYNAIGQRVLRKTRAAGTAGMNGVMQSEVFIYGLQGELLAEIGPTGRVLKEYIYLNNKPFAMLSHTPEGPYPAINADINRDGDISVEDFLYWYYMHKGNPAYDVNGDNVVDNLDISYVIGCIFKSRICGTSQYRMDVYYIHNDHLGTPKLLTDSTGKAVWRVQLALPFGMSLINDDVDRDGHRIEFNLRHPGQYFDSVSGLFYNYYRYYDPQTGRYITSDPIGLNGGINTYAYALNNPLRNIDPLGLWSFNAGAYLGIGGGISMAYADGTFEITGRLGVGLGASASIDPLGKPSKHAKSCGSGYIARTTANVSADFSVGNIGIGRSITGYSGNAVTTPYGGGYVSDSSEIVGGRSIGFGFRGGATVGVEIGSYSNW